MQDQDTPVNEQAQTAERSLCDGAAGGAQPRASKQPYERPEIIDYGSVRDLTRGAGSKPQTDMLTGTRRT